MNESYKHRSLTNSPASSPACSSHSFMKTAVIYARYSSDNQTEQSIEGQLRVCEEYAQRNDILILNTYIDRAVTGTNDNRPDFQQMIKDSNKKEWTYVLVYKIDRFSRNKYETAKYKKILKDNGVKLISAMENIPDTPEGIILESLLEGMAEYYSAELSQKVKRVMHETRLKGNFTGGHLPYGYKLDGRKIVIDEDKIDIVKYIFKQYAIGEYVSNIIKSLTNQGVLNKGKPFTTNTIYNTLRNERYTGVVKREDGTFDNIYPRMIDQETFEKVKAKTKVNRYGKRSTQTIYLLRNKLVCGYCGKPISAETGTNGSGEKVNYYKCIGIKKYHNGCIKKTVRQDNLEEFILNTILNELSKPKTLSCLVKNLLELQNTPSNNTTINMLIKAQKQAENSLNNILNAIEQGIMNKTTNRRMKDLENTIEELERKILIENGKTCIKVSEKQIRKYFIDALKEEPTILINYLVKEIKLYNDKVEITFNNPISKSPNNEGFSFLQTNGILNKFVQHKPQPKKIDMQIKFKI